MTLFFAPLRRRISKLPPVNRLLLRRDPAIFVASIGRSGSTMVFEALNSARGQYSRLFREDISTRDLRPSLVYKTHDFPESAPRDGSIKVVFLFGSASDSVRSAIQRDAREPGFLSQHLIHLKSDMNPADVTTHDVMRIADQLDAWSTCKGLEVLGLRFETVWDHEDALRDFTGLDVTLPPRRNRQSKPLAPDVEAQIARTYSAIDDRIAAMPDIFYRH